jgi:hypothetical protein
MINYQSKLNDNHSQLDLQGVFYTLPYYFSNMKNKVPSIGD